MKKRGTFLILLLVFLICAFSLSVSATSYYWANNFTINSSLPALNNPTHSVFYKDSSWYLISGANNGRFYGFVYNGTNWLRNSTVNSSLPDIGSYSAPSVFYKDSSWYLISGANGAGNIYGFAWNGTQWESNSTINSSLPGSGFYSLHTSVFYKDSSWYILGGAGDGNFYGFVWNGTQWESNSTINSSLPANTFYDFISPSVFYKDSSWYLIFGGYDGNFYGYSWNGTGWSVNLAINSSLPNLGSLTYLTPSVFYKDSSWYMISGESEYGGFYGYSWEADTIPPTYSGVLNNNTFAGQITNFAVNVNDDVALNPNGQYIFSTNNTGVWVNDTLNYSAIDYTGTSFDTSGSGNAVPVGITQNATFFWIIDAEDAAVYKYYMNGTYTQNSFDISGSGILVPQGITQNGTFFWITDFSNAAVYKYYMNGTYTGENFDTSGSGNTKPFGITQNNTFFWIVNLGFSNKKVYKYYMNGTYTGTSFDTSGSGSASSHGITQDGTFFWLLDVSDYKVYKYYMNGTYTQNSFDISGSGISTPQEITQDGTFFWITDSDGSKVYKYHMDDFAYNFTTTPSWANVTKTLNSTVGTTVGYRWYFTDDSGNTNSTSIYVLTTSANPYNGPVSYYWAKNFTINSSLPNLGAHAHPSVFKMGNNWYMISGLTDGKFYGYAWNGTDWLTNTTINSSLFSIGARSAPAIFYKDSSWYLISGNTNGDFKGFAWNGTDWLTNTTINSSLPDIGSYSTPSVFYKDSSWYLISGDGSNPGKFKGFAWNGTDWLSNSTINASLVGSNGYSTPSVFYKDSSWYLMSGSQIGDIYGYAYNGTDWISNSTINSSLTGGLGPFSSPFVFYKDSSWYLMGGTNSRGFYGFSLEADIISPTYTEVSIGGITVGQTNNFAINVNDNLALNPNGQYVFSTNNTGVWVNDSAVNFTTTPSWANVTKTLNSTNGTRVGYRWYFIDNSGNTNSTPAYELTTILDVTPPQYSQISTNQSYAGQITKFAIYFTDDVSLHPNGQYVFSTNNTGVWVNDSAVNFTTTPSWANVTKTLNSTMAPVVGYRWYFNDSIGNFNSTPIYNLNMLWADNGSLVQNLYGCGQLNTENATYNLIQSVITNGTCLTVTAENVTINCGNWNNKIIYGNISNATEYYGIYSTRQRTTIKNCEIAAGSLARLSNEHSYDYRYGIYVYNLGSDFVNCNNSKIENVNASYNYKGIFLKSSSNASLHNVTANSNYIGIHIMLSSYDVLNNITTNFNKDSAIRLDASSYDNISNIIANFNDNGVWVFDMGELGSQQSISSTFFNITTNFNNYSGLGLMSGSMGLNTLFNNTYDNLTSNNNKVGIYSYATAGNHFSNATVNSNWYAGIGFENSRGNNITNVNASLNGIGIYLQNSPNSTLRYTNMSSNSQNFYIFGESNSYFKNSIDSSNTVDYNKKIYYNYSIANYTFDTVSSPNAGMVLCSDCNNITVKDLNLSARNGVGLQFFNTTNSIIQNISANLNDYGIYLDSSLNNNISSIIVNANNISGVNLWNSLNNSLNLITANLNRDGIELYGSSNNSLNLINATGGSSCGITFDYSSSNNSLKNVNMSNNNKNFCIEGTGNYDFVNNIDTSNTVDYNKKIYYNYSIANYTFDTVSSPNAGMVLCSDCNNITVKDLNLSARNIAGAYFFNTNNSRIENVSTNSNGYGIRLSLSSNNNLNSIISNSNSMYGIYLREGSNNYINNFSSWNCSNRITDDGLDYIYSCIYDFGSSDNIFQNIYLNYSALDVNGISLVEGDNYVNGLNSSNNVFRNVVIENINGSDVFLLASSGNSFNNSFVNASYNISKEFIGGSFGGEEPILLLRKWYLDVVVNGSVGYLENANVTGFNASNAEIFSGLTNANGDVDRQELVEYFRFIDRTYAAVYTINTTKTGYVTNSTSYNVTLMHNVNHLVTLASDGTNTEIPVVHLNPGGRGGGNSKPKSKEELDKGYSIIVYKNWKIVFNVENVSHTFQVDNVSNDNIKTSIFSEVQEASLTLGQEKKFEISGDNYYDFLVKLNSISIKPSSISMANITIQTIHEEISSENKEPVKENVAENTTNNTNNDGERVTAGQSKLIYYIIALIFLLLIICIIVALRKRKKNRKYYNFGY